MSIHTDILAILAENGPQIVRTIVSHLRDRGYSWTNEDFATIPVFNALHDLRGQSKVDYHEPDIKNILAWITPSHPEPQPEVTPDKPITRDEAPAPVGQCFVCQSETSAEFLSEAFGNSLVCDLCKSVDLNRIVDNSPPSLIELARMLNTLRTSILTRLK